MKTKRKYRLKQALLALALLLFCLLAYVQLWYHPPLTKGPALVREERVLRYHSAPVWAAKFSPDGRNIASAGVDSVAVIAGAKTGAVLLRLKHPEGLTYLCYSRQGDLIITSAYDGIVRIWNAKNGELVRELKGQGNIIRSLDISANGGMIASGDEAGMISVWETGTGKLLFSIHAHKRIIWDLKFSPDDASLASASFDYTIKIWNTADGALKKVLTEHTQTVVALAYSHDGKLLASTSDDKTIKLWSVGNYSVVMEFQQPEHPQAVSFSPDDQWLITGGRDKPLLGEFLQNFFGDSHYNPGVSMRLWNLRSGKLAQTFRQHFNDVNDVDFSSDGKRIVSASNDHSVRVWKFLPNF